mmetsp:Transcript_40755/g.60396  ORF Transcript_40755/g.60396 Transcript_40755/m.60396 type:complete len:244 (-) Transcript_40755:82-813(-)
MCVTAAKREIYLAKPTDKTNFLMTDIIPIVNKAFPDSFGSKKLAKQAICERGWNPLNYNVLNHEKLEEKEQDEDAKQLTIDLAGLNVSTGIASDKMDEFVKAEMRDEGRRQKIQEKHEGRVEQQSIAEKLRMAVRVTSGQIAGMGHYHLDGNVHDEVKRRATNNEEERIRTEQNRRARDEARVDRYNAAKEKIERVGIDELKSDDLKALVQGLKKDGDSPMKTNIPGLKVQYEGRKAKRDSGN